MYFQLNGGCENLNKLFLNFSSKENRNLFASNYSGEGGKNFNKLLLKFHIKCGIESVNNFRATRDKREVGLIR